MKSTQNRDLDEHSSDSNDSLKIGEFPNHLTSFYPLSDNQGSRINPHLQRANGVVSQVYKLSYEEKPAQMKNDGVSEDLAARMKRARQSGHQDKAEDAAYSRRRLDEMRRSLQDARNALGIGSGQDDGHQQSLMLGDQDRNPLVLANELFQHQLLARGDGDGGSSMNMNGPARHPMPRGYDNLGGNPLMAGSASSAMRDLSSMHMAGLHEPMQQNMFNHQQHLMGGHAFAGQGQYPLGFGSQPSALSAHQALSVASLMPEQNRRGFPMSSALTNRNTPGNQPEQILSGEGGISDALALEYARQGIRPDMATLNGLSMSSGVALQQMLQRGGASEMDAATMARMLGGLQPGGGFPSNFLSAARSRGQGRGRGGDLRPGVPLLTGTHVSPAFSLALACDDEHLSEYQILVRKQLEIFEAQPEDVESNTQGRKKQVSLGQVGLRCKHCASLPLRQRGRGAVYYPAKLRGVYQAAQNMASSHLCESCQVIDESLKIELKALRERRDTASGGKQYWADGASALGLYEAEDGIRLRNHDQ